MAGWTYTGVAAALGIWDANKGDLPTQKSTAFPTLAAGNHGALQDLAFDVSRLAADRFKRIAGVSTLLVSANNGAGDVNGVGTLTITITTA